MHYIKNIKQFIENIVLNNIDKKGSVFMGIVTDGDEIEYFVNSRDIDPFIEINVIDQYKYNFKLLGGENDMYFNFRDVPIEFLVYKKKIIQYIKIFRF